MIAIKTETKTITVHKVGVYLSLEEIDRCINALIERPQIEEADRELAEELHKLLKKANKNIADIKDGMKRNEEAPTEDEVIDANSSNCKTGNCD
tara:strand:+ start:18395 stop:18676 length:282 start_codon:yes stop_codon:yes gene_type:complete